MSFEDLEGVKCHLKFSNHRKHISKSYCQKKNNKDIGKNKSNIKLWSV